MNLMAQGFVLSAKCLNSRQCSPWSCGIYPPRSWHLCFTWPYKNDHYYVVSHHDWKLLLFLLGVCPTLVSTVASVLSLGAPSTVTAQTQGTREPPATAVSHTHPLALLPSASFVLLSLLSVLVWPCTETQSLNFSMQPVSSPHLISLNPQSRNT